jgi:hypothetical protein
MILAGIAVAVILDGFFRDTRASQRGELVANRRGVLARAGSNTDHCGLPVGRLWDAAAAARTASISEDLERPKRHENQKR